MHFKNSRAIAMQPGFMFTIEPVLTEGHHDLRILDDGWTAVTVDGKRTAQWEHTMLITETVSLFFDRETWSTFYGSYVFRFSFLFMN